MTTYMTASGDTWDAIALSIYGDVKYTEYLMSNNQDITLLSIVIFDAGMIINIPDLPTSLETDAGTPPWR